MLRVSMAFVSLVWAASAAAQTGELRLVQELRLGRVDGSGPDVFADIHDLAIDSFGRIYVLDPGWRDVRLFDREGRFVRRLAPEGDGPGERRHRPQFPGRVTWDGSRARLWIDDRRSLSVLDSLGAEYVRDTHMPSSLERDHPTGVVVAVDRDGRVYEQQYRVPGDTVYSYVARGRGTPDYVSIAGDTLGTLDIPQRDLTELDVSPEGWIWARRVGDSDGSIWDVLDNCGVYLGSASVPYPVTVTEVGSAGVIHIVASGPLDIDFILRLRLDMDVRERSC